MLRYRQLYLDSPVLDTDLNLRAYEGVVIQPGEVASVPTGVAVEIPTGSIGLILGGMDSILVAVDSITGPTEITVRISNMGYKPISVASGAKIARLVIIPLVGGVVPALQD